MKIWASGLAALLIATSAACSNAPEGLQIPMGSDVTLEKRDGVTVAGRLVEVESRSVVIEARDGQKTRVPRSDIVALRGATTALPAAPPATPAASAAPPAAATAAKAEIEKPAAPLPRYRDVTLPAGTVLPIELRTTVASETSRVEDPVRGTIRRAVTVNGAEVIPAGATVVGSVTQATRSGRTKGLARVAFRFSTLDLSGDAERIPIRTAAVAREAKATKTKDAAKIGGGAAAGAVIGGILGGGDGAAKGAAIGGAAGTGVVLSTRGEEITIPAGTSVSTQLLEPVTLRVPVRQ
jgi:hypothetical protein